MCLEQQRTHGGRLFFLLDQGRIHFPEQRLDFFETARLLRHQQHTHSQEQTRRSQRVVLLAAQPCKASVFRVGHTDHLTGRKPCYSQKTLQI